MGKNDKLEKVKKWTNKVQKEVKRSAKSEGNQG